MGGVPVVSRLAQYNRQNDRYRFFQSPVSHPRSNVDAIYTQRSVSFLYSLPTLFLYNDNYLTCAQACAA